MVIGLACHQLRAYGVGDQCYRGDNCRASHCRWRLMIRAWAGRGLVRFCINQRGMRVGPEILERLRNDGLIYAPGVELFKFHASTLKRRHLKRTCSPAGECGRAERPQS
jgi:hypothetical protein